MPPPDATIAPLSVFEAAKLAGAVVHHRALHAQRSTHDLAGDDELIKHAIEGLKDMLGYAAFQFNDSALGFLVWGGVALLELEGAFMVSEQ